MKTLHPTIIASFVSAALATTGAVATNTTTLVSPVNFDQASVTQTIFKSDALAQKQLANRKTTSGMRSHYDPRMGKATFVWRAENQNKPDLNLVQPAQRTEYAANFYLNQLTGYSAQASAANQAVLAYTHDTRRGAIVAKYRQEIRGIEVFNKEYNVMMDREHNLVAGAGYFANKTSAGQVLTLLASFGDAEAAIQRAISDVSGGATTATFTKTSTKGKYNLYQATTLSGPKVVGNPRAKKTFYEVNGELIAAYYVEVSVADAQNSIRSLHHSYVVNANNGKILFRNNLKAHATENEFTYRVYADDSGFPWEGPHGDVLPALVQGEDPTTILAAPLVTIDNFDKIGNDDPWLAPDATITSGNNVFAYADIFAPQGFTEGDYTAETTSDKTFDYQLSGDELATDITNGKAGVVNLFFFNNFMHDWWYTHGFDEASGNAQVSNYGRGGEEGDPLEVQAQDYSGLNNANMFTPADGASPRMQQFLYNSKDAENGVDQGLTITSHAGLGLLQSLRLSTFGPSQYDLLSGSIVRLNDGIGTGADGCEAAVNDADLAGNIAIINRGGCDFTVKVLNAQNAGAIAAIVVNDVNDGTPPPMEGENASVTIPNVGLNFAEGNAIYDLLGASEVVTAEMFSNFPLKDSSFDNGIVAHEWGHYIQNRLVGNANGLINFQGEAMGEGWADFHSMMFIVKEADRNIADNENFQVPYTTGTFVEDFFSGIRRVRYTPNMDINPLSFRHIEAGAGGDVGLPGTSVASPHAPGEIWASVLWDVYVALLNTHEFNTAQTRMADYLVAGYKLTPVSPTFTEARDALLAAMFAGDPADYELALAAFARRGMGLSAVSPERTSTDNSGVVEAFDTELARFTATAVAIDNTYNGINAGFCTNNNVLDVGETATLTVTIENNGSEILNNVPAIVRVVSDHNVTLENNGEVTINQASLFAQATSTPITITLNESGIGDALRLEVEFPGESENDTISRPANFNFSTQVNVRFVPQVPVNNTTSDNMETIASANDWTVNVLQGGERAENTRFFDTEFTPFFTMFNNNIDFGDTTQILVNNTFTSDVALETAPFEIGSSGEFSVNFWHYYQLEENFDGGVVEIRLNDREWQDVTAAGGTFAIGYRNTLGSELPGRLTYTGLNATSTIAGEVETINFGDALNGQTAQLRFRLVSDLAVSDFGWVIDNVTINNVASPIFTTPAAGNTQDCDNAAPKITPNSATVTALDNNRVTLSVTATDRNPQDALTLNWVQTAGQQAELLSGSSDSELTLVTPNVASSETLVFQVDVSDGTETTSTEISLIVNDSPNSPPTIIPGVSEFSAIENENATLTAGVSDPDPEDTLTYSWTQLSGPSAEIISGADEATLTVATPEITEDSSLVFQLTVSDGQDSSTISATLNVTNAINEPPVITPVAADVTVDENTQAVLSVNVTDQDPNDTFTFNWVQLSGPQATIVSGATSAMLTVTAPEVEEDSSAVFQVAVSDGKDTTLNTLTLNVTNVVNTPPVVTPVATEVTVDENGQATLSVDVSDQNPEDTLTFSWTQVSGPTASISGADTATITVTPPAVTATTNLVFEVAVSDGTNVTTSQITLVVNNVSPPPTTTPDSGSSGGSMPWYSVLLLPLVWLRRTLKNRAQCC